MNTIEQYQFLHSNTKYFGGTAIKGFIEDIGELIRESDSKTLLDYGCGKAVFYLQNKCHVRWGIEKPYLYDPGVLKHDAIHSEKPVSGAKFDAVICTDVLEHVENPEQVIGELLDYADKFLFCSISCRESAPQKRLPDGRGFHITVHPPSWWKERIFSERLKIVLKFDVPE